MKSRNSLLIILLIFAVLLLVNCGDKGQKEQAASDTENPETIVEEVADMPTTAIGAIFQVDDFEKWTAVYNREVPKETRLGTLRSLENPNLIFVIQRSETHENARDLVNSDDVKEVMKEGTVSSEPQFQFYNIKSYVEAPEADEFRLAVIAEVLNFEMWRNDFDRDEFNRKEAGLNLLGLATDAESDNRVYIMFSCADQQKVYDFMSSDNTKQAISDSGVIGEPNMTWWRVP